MFMIKKLISAFLQPLSLSLEIMLCGLVLLWFTRQQKLGRIVTTAGFLLLVFLSVEPVANRLLEPIENRYPPLLVEGQGNIAVPTLAGAPWIVVLGGGSSPDRNIPATSRLSLESLARLTEAFRLYRSLPGSRLVLSGGAVWSQEAEADALAEAARTLGIPSHSIRLERQSRDTEEQALLIKPLVGDAPFLLVTSAYHMPRSLALFKKQGMSPVPAPAVFMIREGGVLNPTFFFPNADKLQKSERAFHEYLGLSWSWLRNNL